MNDHLQQFHQIDKEHPVDPASSLGARSAITNGPGTIKAAFARGLQRIEFNKDIIKAVLIQGIYINNISFRVVEQRSFRRLLMYLLACLSSAWASPLALEATMVYWHSGSHPLWQPFVMVSLPLELPLGTGFYVPTMLLACRLSNSSVNPSFQYISALICGLLQIIEHSLDLLVIASTKLGMSMWLCLEWSNSRVLIEDGIRQR